jgi:F-type H+-transporting ATPase subunit epsilon
VINRIFVAGGFAEVTEGRCTVLAEEAIPLAEMTREGVEAQLAAARDALQEADEALEKAQAESRIKVAEAMLDALAS